jgi:signal peptidase I
VVFKRPPGESGDPSIKDLIKRVIALPGETIESREGQVYIGGRLLSEPYLPRGTQTLNLPLRTIPADQYFVMGDNRTNSEDSRYFGPISKDLIVGKMAFKAWPLDDSTWLAILSIIGVVVLVLLLLALRAPRPPPAPGGSSPRGPPASNGSR